MVAALLPTAPPLPPQYTVPMRSRRLIRVTRRRVLLAVLALLLVSVVYIAWTLAGLPPVKYYFRYGLDPYCEPTGEKETYEGVEFVEIGPGIFRMGSTFEARGGDWLGRVCAPFGLPWGKHPEASWEMPVHWVEFRRGFWVATTEITNAQFERFDPEHGLRVYEGGDHPVDHVSWENARSFCARRSQGGRYGSRARRNGSVCVAPGATTIYRSGTTWRDCASTRGLARMRRCGRILWRPNGRTAGASTTCTATYGSGARTGGTGATRARRETVRRGQKPTRRCRGRWVALFAAVATSTLPRSIGRRAGASYIRNQPQGVMASDRPSPPRTTDPDPAP